MNKNKIVAFASTLSALLGTAALALAFEPPSAAQCDNQFSRTTDLDCSRNGLVIDGIANQVAVTITLLQGSLGTGQGFDINRVGNPDWSVSTSTINTPKTSFPLRSGLEFFEVGGNP